LYKNKMRRKDLLWAVPILILLFLVMTISMMFYFKLIIGSSTTGHIIFEDRGIHNSSSEQNVNFSVIENNTILKALKSAG